MPVFFARSLSALRNTKYGYDQILDVRTGAAHAMAAAMRHRRMIMKTRSLIAMFAALLAPLLVHAQDVCFVLENVYSSPTTVEVIDQVCNQNYTYRLDASGGKQGLCTCADNIGKASIKTRFQGNQIWTRHEFINSGDVVKI